MRWVKLACCICIGWISWSPCRSQEALKAPVLKIQTEYETGAGFLVGSRGDELFAVTAFHVIEEATEITGWLFSNQRENAQVVTSSRRLDLAVISLPKPPGYNPPISFSIANASLFPGARGIKAIGHPLGASWDINYNMTCKAIEYDSDRDFFTLLPVGIAQGNSGGPILNESDELLGMVQEIDRVNAICLKGSVLERALKNWNVPTNLLNGLGGTPEAHTDPLAGEFIWVEGGSFEMGSEEGDGDEKPIHVVEVADFYMGKYEVTVAQFEQFVNATNYQTDAEKEGWSYLYKDGWKPENGVNWTCDEEGKPRPRSEFKHPVIHVSWNDAQAYCKWLSTQTGTTYRLPNEAEWEYAAGGGSENRTTYVGTSEISQLSRYGNFCDKGCSFSWATEDQDDGFQHSAPAGTFLPNSLALFDMSGNVWEWCQDRWHDSYQGAPTDGSAWESGDDDRRVLRGGSWSNTPAYLRVAFRDGNTPTVRSYYVGIRLARTP